MLSIEIINGIEKRKIEKMLSSNKTNRDAEFCLQYYSLLDSYLQE
jgi:hypothetical protein